MLGGAVDVSLIDAGLGLFAPMAGNVFEILTAAGNITGNFAITSLPALAGGLFWEDVQYGLHSVKLEVGGIAGDFNRDGPVDAAYYVTWRKNDGTQAGYNTWRTHFGEPSGAETGATGALPFEAAVPEPSTLVLLVYAAAGWCLRRSRHT